MTFSALIAGTLPHHGKYGARGVAVSRVIVHHWAGTSGGDVSLASPGRDASANYIIYGDGRIVGQVPEEFRAWTSGSPAADNPSITVEIQNSTGAPEWRVSDKAIQALIALTADIAKRYGWGSVTRSRVLGHREFAATACPGPYLFPRLGDIAEAANLSINTTPEGQKGADEMLLSIQGKAGARRGGLYVVVGGVATFVGGPLPAGVPHFTDEKQIAALQGRVSGLR